MFLTYRHLPLPISEKFIFVHILENVPTNAHIQHAWNHFQILPITKIMFEYTPVCRLQLFFKLCLKCLIVALNFAKQKHVCKISSNQSMLVRRKTLCMLGRQLWKAVYGIFITLQASGILDRVLDKIILTIEIY